MTDNDTRGIIGRVIATFGLMGAFSGAMLLLIEALLWVTRTLGMWASALVLLSIGAALIATGFRVAVGHWRFWAE